MVSTQIVSAEACGHVSKSFRCLPSNSSEASIRQKHVWFPRPCHRFLRQQAFLIQTDTPKKTDMHKNLCHVSDNKALRRIPERHRPASGPGSDTCSLCHRKQKFISVTPCPMLKLAQLSKWQLSNEQQQPMEDSLAMTQYLRDMSMRGTLLQNNLPVMSKKFNASRGQQFLHAT